MPRTEAFASAALMGDALLPCCGVADLADVHAARHLQVDHHADEKNAQRRSDRKLGADPQILDDADHINSP